MIPGASWMQQTLLVLTCWFVVVIMFVGLIYACRTWADRRRFIRQRDEMFAELALIVLDPKKGQVP